MTSRREFLERSAAAAVGLSLPIGIAAPHRAFSTSDTRPI